MTWCSKDILNKTPFSQELQPTTAKWDFIKLESFCTAKEAINRVGRNPTEREGIFVSYTSDRNLTPRP